MLAAAIKQHFGPRISAAELSNFDALLKAMLALECLPDGDMVSVCVGCGIYDLCADVFVWRSKNNNNKKFQNCFHFLNQFFDILMSLATTLKFSSCNLN